MEKEKQEMLLCIDSTWRSGSEIARRMQEGFGVSYFGLDILNFMRVSDQLTIDGYIEMRTGEGREGVPLYRLTPDGAKRRAEIEVGFRASAAVFFGFFLFC